MTTLPLAPASSPVTCSLCGLEYVPGGDTCREHGCPIAIGGCATRHCPRCGHTMPDEEKSVAARFVRRLFRPRPRHAAGTLAELPAGSFAVVEGFLGDPSYGGNKGRVGWRLVGFDVIGTLAMAPPEGYDGPKCLRECGVHR